MRTSDQSTIHFTGLGLTKSLQEFLVLHYYATDSATSWFDLLSDWFPQVRWPSPGRLRHLARDIFRRIHVAPSHRRAPHPCWTGPMNLVLRLMLGPGRRQIISFKGTPTLTNVYDPWFLSRVVCRTDGPTSSLEATRTLCSGNPWRHSVSTSTLGKHPS